MAVASLVTALVLIAGASAAGSRRTSSAKWAQTRKTLLITVPLRRDKVNCGSEAAEMKSPTQLSFSTECENGESFHLDLELQHAVEMSLKLKPDARRSSALITLTKATSEWWTHLAAKPEQYKRLIERDPSRGESEPDEEEEATLEQQLMMQHGFDEEQTEEEKAQRATQILQNIQDDLRKGRKITTQAITNLRKERKAARKRGDGRVAYMLGTALLGRPQVKQKKGEAEGALREALKLEPDLGGAHQVLAHLLRERTGQPEALAEAASLFQIGVRLIPNDHEAYYQLGRLKNVDPSVSKGGRNDEASAAWRGALRANASMVEAHQLLAMRLGSSKSSKARRVAQQHARKAVELTPRSAMSYAGLGIVLSGSNGPDGEKANAALEPKVAAKAIDALRTALELGKKGSFLPKVREAQLRHELGRMYAMTVNPSEEVGQEAVAMFRAAAELDPSPESGYAQSVVNMENGIEEYAERRRAYAMQKQKESYATYLKNQRDIEDREDNEADDDVDDFVETRTYA